MSEDMPIADRLAADPELAKLARSRAEAAGVDVEAAALSLLAEGHDRVLVEGADPADDDGAALLAALDNPDVSDYDLAAGLAEVAGWLEAGDAGGLDEDRALIALRLAGMRLTEDPAITAARRDRLARIERGAGRPGARRGPSNACTVPGCHHKRHPEAAPTFQGLAVEVLDREGGGPFPRVRVRYLASPSTPAEWVAADAIAGAADANAALVAADRIALARLPGELRATAGRLDLDPEVRDALRAAADALDLGARDRVEVLPRNVAQARQAADDRDRARRAGFETGDWPRP
jgi:hypothetical protein